LTKSGIDTLRKNLLQGKQHKSNKNILANMCRLKTQIRSNIAFRIDIGKGNFKKSDNTYRFL
jgi:hypothetical protein